MDRTEHYLRELVEAIKNLDWDATLKAQKNAITYLKELEDVRQINKDRVKRIVCCDPPPPTQSRGGSIKKGH